MDTRSRPEPKTFGGKDQQSSLDFLEIYPSETAGDGKPVSNNLHSGTAQGKSSLIRKAHCQQCGFPVNLSVVDHTGGSLDGDGAEGPITAKTATYKDAWGTLVTVNYGQIAVRVNDGCPFCLSKNSTPIRQSIIQENPWSNQQNDAGLQGF